MKPRKEKRDSDHAKEETIYEDAEQGLAVIEEQISDTYNEGTIDQKENK